MKKNLIIRIGAAVIVFVVFALIPVGQIFSTPQVPIIINPDKAGSSDPSGADSSSSNKEFSYKELEKEQKELPPMSKDGDFYSIQAQAQDETGVFKVISFKIERGVIEDLGFTEEEARNACEAAGGSARKYIETFIYNGTPEIRMRDGEAVVVIPMIVGGSNPARMFISGKVTKSGQALPMRATREDEI